MAFLTGVDLEGRLQEEEEAQLALPAPARRPPRRPRPALQAEEAPLALENQPPGNYSQLLKDCMALEEGDPLEKLRRMIKRTRSKMDSQTKVLDGFISEVGQIKGMQRNFSCSDIDKADSASMKALPAKASQAELMPGKAASQRALKGSSSSTALVPSESRGQPKRSAGPPALGTSQSQPCLSAAPALLALQRDAAPLVVPQRRSPPGAGPLLTRELAKGSSSRSSSRSRLRGY
eukprot:TRINITY_DN51023_c0_g1_i1.p1 TRINITY_DN51023_c0_g1~~TRINITY_DN51023_c0_g1_i1.p1  ORF type:complete len:248 (-),score=54.22 TRINITY_DN51023_c0_g1_i1:37-738(-)